MDYRVVDGVISTKYKKGVEYFYGYAFRNMAHLHQGQARCPYKRCDNREMVDRNTMTVYLYRSRFMSTTSISTCMKRCERQLQGLEMNRIGT